MAQNPANKMTEQNRRRSRLSQAIALSMSFRRAADNQADA
jgi:hypothetical protein